MALSTPLNPILPTIGAKGVVTHSQPSRYVNTAHSMSITEWAHDAGTGITDDSVAFQQAVNALAGTGIALFIPAGTYVFANPVTVPSNIHILIDEGAVIAPNLGITGTLTNAAFVALPVISGTSTTLNGTPTLGGSSLTITSATGFTQGSKFQITRAGLPSVVYTYVVETISGTTVTTDHPLLIAWQSGDSVELLSSGPTNIVIEGKGSIVGTADTFVYIKAGTDCQVNDLVMQPTAASTYLLAFVEGFRNRSERVRVEASGNGSTGTNPQPAGILLQAEHGSIVAQCAVKNFATSASESCGVLMLDAAECEFQSPQISGCVIGIGFSAAAGQTSPGCYSWKVIGGSSVDNGTGFAVANGSSHGSAVGLDVSYNTGNGALNETNCVGNAFVGCKFNGNVGNGLISSGDKVQLCGCDVGGNGGIGIETVNGTIQIYGLTAATANTSGLFAAGTGTTQANIAGVDAVLGTGFGVLSQGAGCRVNIDGATFNAGGTVLEVTSSSVLTAENVMLTGVATTGLSIASGTTARIGDNVHLTAATTPVSNAGALNRKGTVVANGATGVAVAFPDITADDVVLFTLQTSGGTVGHPTYTITAGTGFTFASQASDTSTYEWFIS
jgi:hypothetical protein